MSSRETTIAHDASNHSSRVCVDGKHLQVGERPFRVRGVTYGTFAARHDGALFPSADRVRADFEAIARAGLNTVRTYTVPPPDILDLAELHGLRCIVGLSYDDWRMELHTGRAAHRRVLDAGRRAVDAAAGVLAGRSSVIAVSVGNEVPADVLRVHGAREVEGVLGALVGEVHRMDGNMLATYTNFPTTEFLRVEGQDIASFNVFLEQRHQLRPYLRRLMVVAGDAPLLLTEVGLAAGIHGAEAQAASLKWQLDEIDEAGAAGATVFSWTDDWVVAGAPVDGWGFGLTDAERKPKQALDVVARWARRDIVDQRARWPSVSAVVCVRNGAAVIRDCLSSLMRSDYPNLEVIVCDDGSDDDTAAIASGFPCRVLRLPHGGLSRARNAGTAAATGEIVAFIDADAACHAHWPYHLARSLEDPAVAATGGPNLPFSGVGLVERAVAASPGNPAEVLIAHDRAEHVPGCNMAFRRSALMEIGGFDPVYTTAGDDVDVCWKLLDRGHDIAFAAAAQVQHHRRGTIRGFLRQQAGYGRAEALLAARHPERFNRLGQARWSGVVYGRVGLLETVLRPVVYHGAMGTAPFQPVVRRRSEETLARVQAYLPVLGAALPLGLLVPASPWWLVAPALVLGLMLVHASAVAVSVRPARDEPRPLGLRCLVALLHVLQPIVRAQARLRAGVPTVAPAASWPWRGDRQAWIDALQRDLAAGPATVRCGHPHAEWDLDVTVGPFLSSRVATAVAWGWEPLSSARLRPRIALVVATAAALALALFSPVAAVFALVVVGATTTTEAFALRSLVAAALERTTRESSVMAGQRAAAAASDRRSVGPLDRHTAAQRSAIAQPGPPGPG